MAAGEQRPHLLAGKKGDGSCPPPLVESLQIIMRFAAGEERGGLFELRKRDRRLGTIQLNQTLGIPVLEGREHRLERLEQPPLY